MLRYKATVNNYCLPGNDVMIMIIKKWHTICIQFSKSIIMSDNKSNTSQQDRIRIDINDPSEVEYVHKQFPELEHEQIVDAIREAGPMRKDVMEYLKKKYRV